MPVKGGEAKGEEKGFVLLLADDTSALLLAYSM